MELLAEFDNRLGPDQPPPGAVEHLGGVTIGRKESGDGNCRQFIVLTGRTQIEIRASDPQEQPAPVDLCAVAETATRAAVAILGNWKCNWGTPDEGTPAVEVLLYRGNPPSAAPGFELRPIGGRLETVVWGGFEDLPQVCLAEVPQRRFTARNGETRAEGLVVWVHGPQPMETLCRLAVDLTEHAVLNLPPPQ